MRGGGPQTPRGRALRRQPAEGHPRPRDRPRPEGADRRPADARARRRRDRVRPPAARSRSATRAARSCSSRSSSRRSCRCPTASSSCTRARSSASSRRRDRGGARHRDDRRRRGPRRQRERASVRATRLRRCPRTRAASARVGSRSRSSERYGCRRRRAGSLAPVLTGAARVRDRRARRDRDHDRQATRSRPTARSSTAPGSTGSSPGSRARARVAAVNLQQTLIITTTLDPHGPRGRVRLPLRPVQHRRAGAVHRRRDPRRLGRLVVQRHELRSCTSSSRSSPARSAAPPGRGSPAS